MNYPTITQHEHNLQMGGVNAHEVGNVVNRNALINLSSVDYDSSI